MSTVSFWTTRNKYPTAVEIAQIIFRKVLLIVSYFSHINTKILSKEISRSRGSQPKVVFLLVPLKFFFICTCIVLITFVYHSLIFLLLVSSLAKICCWHLKWSLFECVTLDRAPHEVALISEVFLYRQRKSF